MNFNGATSADFAIFYQQAAITKADQAIYKSPLLTYLL